MLTYKGGLAGALVVVLVLAAWILDAWPLVLAAVPLVLALSWGAVRHGGRRPELVARHRVGNRRLLAGDVVEAALEIDNPGDDLGPCQIDVDLPEGLRAVERSPSMFAPLGERTCTYRLQARERGRYGLGAPRVRERGTLGLFARTLEAPAEASLRVRPGRERLEATPTLARPNRVVLGNVQAGQPGHGGEFYALREYAPGDPFGAVNWKRTAKHGHPIVNEREQEAPVDLVLILDARREICLGEGPSATLEAAIRAVASIAERGLEDRLNVGLVVAGEETTWLEPATGSDHQRRVLEALLGVSPGGSGPLDEKVGLSRDRFPKGSEAIVVSPATNDASLRRLLRTLARLDVPAAVLAPSPVVAETEADPDEADREPDLAARLAALEHRRGLETLRRVGAGPVVGWDQREPLGVAVSEVFASHR